MRHALLLPPLLAALTAVVALGCEEGPAPEARRASEPARDAALVPTSDASPVVADDAFLLPDMATGGVGPGCDDVDADGDGWGATGACGPLDCDDANRAIHPGAPEACNDLDEDCDGATDEGLSFASCGRGACRRQMPNCSMGRPQRCAAGEPAPEQCNTIDDDCDGATDEDASAATCGVGACARSGPCVDGVPGECSPGDPVGETCNGADDDCDGNTDEGLTGASVIGATYGALTGLHAGCGGDTERIGPNCNAAMSRFCAAQPCRDTGFGPVENSGDTAVVTCLSADLRQVSFATLASHHPNCNAAPERIGPNCNAAIHRYCASEGFVSGFGPVESGPDFVVVACVRDGAVSVGTRYSVLTGYHGPCNGSVQRIGPDCNAAIHRFCASQGHASGFGPVESSGDDAAVVCVDP